MPCRKENYILLEQSVTVDSKEVDALVTKIGEALQLHNNSATMVSSLHHQHGLNGQQQQQSNNNNTGALLHHQTRTGCCVRLRNSRGQTPQQRGSRRSSRASPYNVPLGPPGPGAGEQDKWGRMKPWSRRRANENEEDDDPHRLLQELILSGNLIKEAVRRLQFSGVTDCP